MASKRRVFRARSRAAKKGWATRRETDALALALARRQKIGRSRARAKAKIIVRERHQRVDLVKEIERRERRVRAKQPLHVVEYEAKIGYKRKAKREGGEKPSAVLVNFRFKWTGHGPELPDALIREYAYQSLRVDGFASGDPQAAQQGFEWAWINWANGKGTPGWRANLEGLLDQAEPSDADADLIAFLHIVEHQGRGALTIGKVSDSWETGDNDEEEE